MKRFYFLFLSLLMMFPVFAQDADRTLTDSGDVPELVATYGDGTLLGVADFRDDNTMVAGATFGVWLYDLTRLNELQAGETLSRRLLEHPGGVTDIRFSADRSRMVTTAWGTARLWDMIDERLIAEIPAYDTATLSADENYLLGGDGTNRVNIWNLDDLSAPLASVETGGTRPDAIQFSPDGELVTITGVLAGVCPTADYTRIDVYAVDDLLAGGEPLYQLETDQHNAPVVFSPDSTRLVYGPVVRRVAEVGKEGISNDTTFTVSYQDVPDENPPAVQILDARTGEPLLGLLPEFTAADVLLYEPDGSLLMHVTPRRGGPPSWWRWAGQGEPSFVDQTGNFLIDSSFRLSPGGTRAVYGRLWELHLLNAAEDMAGVRNFFDENEVEGDWIFTPTPLAISRMDGEAILAQANTLGGSDLVSLDGTVAVDERPGITASAQPGNSGHIFIFTSVTGELLSTVTVPAPDHAAYPAISPDGRYFAAIVNEPGCDYSTWRIMIWEIASGEKIYERPGVASKLVFHPTLPLLAVVDGVRVRLLDWERDEIAADWRAGEMSVTEAAFSADGALLFTYSLDGTIRAWKIED